MAKRLPEWKTPKSRVRSALRQYVWMRSKERAAALKREGYTCQGCGKKQSRAKGKEFKVEVHHMDGIDWSGLIDDIIERLLPHPDRLGVYCKECHKKEHEDE